MDAPRADPAPRVPCGFVVRATALVVGLLLVFGGQDGAARVVGIVLVVGALLAELIGSVVYLTRQRR